MVTESQLNNFIGLVQSGDFSGAANYADALGVPTDVTAAYVNANAAGLGLGSDFGGVTGADVQSLVTTGGGTTGGTTTTTGGGTQTTTGGVTQSAAERAAEDKAVLDFIDRFQQGDPTVPIPYAVWAGALYRGDFSQDAISRVTGADPGFITTQNTALNQIQPSGYSDAQVAVWFLDNPKGANESQSDFETRIFNAMQASGVGIDQVSRVTGADPGYVGTRYEEIAKLQLKPPKIIPKEDLTKGGAGAGAGLSSIPRLERQTPSMITFAPLQRGLGQLRPAAFMPGLLQGQPGFGGSGFTPEQLQQATTSLVEEGTAAGKTPEQIYQDFAYLMDVGGVSAAELAAAIGGAPGQIQGLYNQARPQGLFSTAPPPRQGPTFKDTSQLGAFNSAIARGDFATGAQIAQAAGFSPQEAEYYINANLSGLNQAQPIAPGTIGSLYGPNAPTPPGLALQTGAFGATVPTFLPSTPTDTATTPGSATNINVLNTLENLQTAVNELQNPPEYEGSKAGGLIKMAEGGMPKLSAEEAGSTFDSSEFVDEQGRLVGGYNRPIYEDNVLVGYEFVPYGRDVVFGKELRERESRGSSASELEMAMRSMLARQGRTGVSPYTGGLPGIMAREAVMRRRPEYYDFAEGGLADVAQNLADRGRKGDSMLVHMAPEEVAGLRALARAQGTDLTINPRTGLPEAFSLKKLFKAASFILPFVPIPGLFGMSSLLTRSILSGVAAGASAKGGFDLKQALGGGLKAYALGSLGEKMSGAATPGGTPTTPPTTVSPEMGGVNVMGEVTGVPGEIPSPSELAQYQGVGGAQGAPVNMYGSYSDTAGGIQTAPRVSIGPNIEAAAPIDTYTLRGGPQTGEAFYNRYPSDAVTTTPGSLPPGTESVPGRMASVITPEGQGFGQPLTKGTEIAMAGLGGLSLEKAAEEQRSYDIKAAAARREDEERRRRFDELFRRTLGNVPMQAASGGLMKLAGGGMTYMEGGGATGPAGEPRVIRGTGDGMSDSVPATIEGVQEARLANDEFVIPADVVADIGNGSSDAGAKKLYGMMDRIRKARHGTTKQPPEINAERYMAA